MVILTRVFSYGKVNGEIKLIKVSRFYQSLFSGKSFCNRPQECDFFRASLCSISQILLIACRIVGPCGSNKKKTLLNDAFNANLSHNI